MKSTANVWIVLTIELKRDTTAFLIMKNIMKIGDGGGTK